MPVIIVPVSGGIDSTNLLQKAMSTNSEVHPVFIEASGVPQFSVSDVTATEKIVKYFRDDAASKFSGRMKPLKYHFSPIFNNETARPANTPARVFINQQFSVMFACCKLRSFLWDCNPAVLMGWLKEDTSDFSFNEFDFSPSEYKELLDLPVTIGKLSNMDRTCKPFRAPLWDKTKKEIFEELDEDLKTLVIPNGFDRITNKVVRVPNKTKLTEWKAGGIPIKEEYGYDFSELSLVGKVAGGLLKAKDFGYSPNYDRLVKLVFRNYRAPDGFFTLSDLENNLSETNIHALVKEIQANCPKLK